MKRTEIPVGIKYLSKLIEHYAASVADFRECVARDKMTYAQEAIERALDIRREIDSELLSLARAQEDDGN